MPELMHRRPYALLLVGAVFAAERSRLAVTSKLLGQTPYAAHDPAIDGRAAIALEAEIPNASEFLM
jgi:hypothetical protein